MRRRQKKTIHFLRRTRFHITAPSDHGQQQRRQRRKRCTPIDHSRGRGTFRPAPATPQTTKPIGQITSDKEAKARLIWRSERRSTSLLLPSMSCAGGKRRRQTLLRPDGRIAHGTYLYPRPRSPRLQLLGIIARSDVSVCTAVWGGPGVHNPGVRWLTHHPRYKHMLPGRHVLPSRAVPARQSPRDPFTSLRLCTTLPSISSFVLVCAGHGRHDGRTRSPAAETQGPAPV